MRFRFLFFGFLLILSACNPSSSNSLEISREGMESAVVNLILANQESNLQALSRESAFFLQVDATNISLPEMSYETGEQAFVALNASTANEEAWGISIHPSVATAFVIDLNASTLNADLSELIVPRFDVVSSDSTLNLTLATGESQLALDASNSTISITIPTGAIPQVSQFVTNGSFVEMQVAEGLSFEAAMDIRAGGFTLIVPSSTGVQVLVESTEQAEISILDIPRLEAEVTSYFTVNYGTATNQVILRVNLTGASLRVEQD